MADMMTFPNTVEEFMEQYKIVDTEKIYTNGAELVPIFRMMQWFEHVSAMDTISRQAAIDAILHITNCKSVRELFEYNQLHHLTEMWSGGVNDAIDAVIGVDSAQLGTNLAEVGTDCISRQAALDIFDDYNAAVENGQIEAYRRDRKRLCDLPPAQLGTNLTEEYARAVRNWLVNYQVKCADLAGRYTPYEVLGWIVSDWRKENGIW